MPSRPHHPSAHAVIRLLLVEDESKLLRSLVEGLSLEDWSVAGVTAGAAAWRQIESDSFDLIVLDRMLPDCDGLELVRGVREARRHVPILVMTARAGQADRETALRVGASDFLSKPFSFDDLIARARTLLGVGQ